jgi:hypothetical protein
MKFTLTETRQLGVDKAETASYLSNFKDGEKMMGQFGIWLH